METETKNPFFAGEWRFHLSKFCRPQLLTFIALHTLGALALTACSSIPIVCPLDLELKETRERGHVQTFCARSPVGANFVASGYFAERESSGVLRCAGQMRSGRRDGEWLCFHPDGTLETRIAYRDGMREGSSVLYGANGQLEARNRWSRGLFDGPQRFYRASGTLEFEQEYSRGRPHGWLRGYSSDGDWTFRSLYRNGEKVGCAEERGSRSRAWVASCEHPDPER